MKSKYIVIALLILGTLPAFADKVNDQLSLLDDAVEHRQEYLDIRLSHIEELKYFLSRAPEQSKFQICEEIFESYWGFNNDSALVYSELCGHYAVDPKWGSPEKLQQATIYKVQCMAIVGLYEPSKNAIARIESDGIYPENRIKFYQIKSLVQIWEKDFSSQLTFDAQREISIRDSIIRYEPEEILRTHQQSIIASFSSPEEALEILRPVLDTISDNNLQTRFIANSAASFYARLGERDSAIYYYAKSALSDLKQGVLEHASLREVALLMFEQGDVMMAYRFMKCCMKDAEMSGARLRTIQMAEDLPFILDAYQEKVESQRNGLLFAMAILIITLVALAIMFYRTHKIKLRLLETGKKMIEYHSAMRKSQMELRQVLKDLKQSNADLIESNSIKEVYVIQYMKQCSANINKIEEYRLKLQKTALTSNFGKLVQVIKDTDVVNKEYEEFYQSFDETFLTLFPNFIEEFNSLLRPEERFVDTESKRLKTELRIFALIRLGINDSEEIAQFLRYSVKTIFNYRTKIRSKAEGDRLEFEDKVKKIGMVSSIISM